MTARLLTHNHVGLLLGVGGIHNGLLLFAEDSNLNIHANPRGRGQVGILDGQEFFGKLRIRVKANPGATRADPCPGSSLSGATIEARPGQDLADFQFRAEVVGWEEYSTPSTFRPQLLVVEVDMERTLLAFDSDDVTV